MNSLGSGKVPGPDAFILEFYQNFWNTIKDSYMDTVHTFYIENRLPESWGRTNLVFVPKKDNPKEIKDFRPIALCNVAYKILSKALLDLEKAFNRVDWDGLYDICKCMNFPLKLINWFMVCLRVANFMCCVNREQSCSFSSYKGVRQADPLSPYLFIILQELLSVLINRSINLGLIKGFKYRGLTISHLFFADDIIMVVKCNKSSCSQVMEVLDCYGTFTNQKVNFNKSKLDFPYDYPKEKKDDICKLMGINEGSLPFKYLGTSIGKSRLPINIQRQIVAKAESKIESWASRNISQAGKVILLNSVVNSTPIHSLATSWLSEKVVKEYEGLAKNYLWKSRSRRHGFHLIGWKIVTLSKSKGGLGIKDLNLMKLSI
ncbi:hypothetical protein Cni_G19718 [Canna indica]|uniref:Reverse transcriptase domain-containing protein n=1 Tax=Canna indica TaxID=4628 RepID=A0AAQ3KQ02_9LILI|nr:hypothetical protein Cni_G19718 [Canna indica]